MRKPEPAISRVLSSTTIHLGQPSPTASSNLPGSAFGTDAGQHQTPPMGALCVALLPYLVLLQAGFTVPRAVTSRAVRSYRTFSPLPAPVKRRRAVYFLWHFPWARALQVLPGALSEGARTFLYSKLQRLPGRLWLSRARILSAICPSGAAINDHTVGFFSSPRFALRFSRRFSPEDPRPAATTANPHRATAPVFHPYQQQQQQILPC